MGNSVKPRVMFTFVEAGMGHIIPMTGMSEAFSRKYGDKCEIINSYIFRDTKYDSVKNMGSQFANAVKKVNKNYILNRLEAMSYWLSSGISHFGLDIHFKKGIADCTKELCEVNPDLVVGSYYMPNHIVAKANGGGVLNALTVTYTPDSYIYPAWDRRCDLYLVHNESAKKDAVKKGFKKECVKQIPFIFRDGIININATKEQACDEVGLDKNKFRILYTSGAYATGISKKSRALIDAIVNSGIDAELTVICGKNPQAEEKLKEIAVSLKGSVTMNVVSFTNKIEYYMRGADVIIGKSGMNTIMEALYLGTPIIINESVNRLEETIADWVVDCGFSLIANTPKKVVETIKEYIENPSTLNKFLQNYSIHRDSTGAEKAADSIYELLKTRFPNL